jgi:hypothetical protein
MTVYPLTHEYLSSRYSLTPACPVCRRRAWYKARVHPLARDPAEPHRRWLERRFPKRSSDGGPSSHVAGGAKAAHKAR